MVDSKAILDLLADGKERTIPTITKELNIKDTEALRSQLYYLTRDGLIKRVARGRYVIIGDKNE